MNASSKAKVLLMIEAALKPKWTDEQELKG